MKRIFVCVVLVMVMLVGCVPPSPTVEPATGTPELATITPVIPSPTPTSTATVTATATRPQSPLITPTRPPSPLITPTPPNSLIATPQVQLVRASTVLSNVLTNGGMNLPYVGMPGQMTINLPVGWLFGWAPHPLCTHNDPPGCSPVIPCPINCTLQNGNCSNDEGCYWAQPEASRILAVEFDGLRTREGDASAKAFTVGRMGQWWYYQTVEVGAGNVVTLSAYLQAWMCFDFADCSKGQRSDVPTTMHLRVGIDPFGGQVVTGANVIWSPEGDAYRIEKNSPNIWRQFVVTTTARARYVTVFIYTAPDWALPALDFPALYDGNHARQNNDIYIDDARLAVEVIHPIFKVYLPLMRR